jgi:hypothetical protein
VDSVKLVGAASVAEMKVGLTAWVEGNNPPYGRNGTMSTTIIRALRPIRIAGRKHNFRAESRNGSKVIERLHPPGRTSTLRHEGLIRGLKFLKTYVAQRAVASRGREEV